MNKTQYRTVSVIVMIVLTGWLLNHRLSSSIGRERLSPPLQKSNAATNAPADFNDLLDAIEWVESKGNFSAIGDNGNAVGAYQIWPIYVKDVNRILGKEVYTLADRYDRIKSRQMCRIYITHYGRTFEEMAAVHCAGPDGWKQIKKPKVKEYVQKIKKELDKNSK